MADEHLRDVIESERTIHQGKSYTFTELTLRQPDGSTRAHPIVRHRGSVVIAPLLEQPGRPPKLVFVRNDRHALNAKLDELPAGGVDEGETPEEAAARELEEETGYDATSLYPLGRFYNAPGMTDELMHAFVATGLVRGQQRLQPDESLTVHTMSATAALDAISEGRLTDGKSMLTILWAQRAGYLG